ncbi:MAG: efflux RND transporter permease subunit, partial [Pirellula sp.]
SILAVFVPTFFMQGAPREMFLPLSLAVGFAMIASYLLSSTFVPVLCVWLLKVRKIQSEAEDRPTLLGNVFGSVTGIAIAARWVLIPAYLVLTGFVIATTLGAIGVNIFPPIDAGEFRIRMRAPDGTHIDVTENLAQQVLESVGETVGPGNVALTLGYVGTVPASFPINAVYQFSRGPEEAILRIALKPNTGVRTDQLTTKLRDKFRNQFPQVRFSFEPADIISEIMSFGSPTPIEVAVRGGSIPENRDFLSRVQMELSKVHSLRDVQVVQSLDYPTIDVRIDREKAGLAGATAAQVGRSVLAATSSSRFVVPNYWPDPKTGIGYQVQVEIPQPALKSIADLEKIPVLQGGDSTVLLRDVATLSQTTMPGQFDRYNMKRELTLTANFVDSDLGLVSQQVHEAVARVKKQDDENKDKLEKEGQKPGRVSYELRGQIPPLRQMLSGLAVGLVLALLSIFLMLSANFQSFRLSLVCVSTAPAVIAGSCIMLWMTGSSLNIQSFIGTIMGLGVAMANAILVVTFAEERRMSGELALQAAKSGIAARVRPVLMTSLAMLAGMLPLALGLGESGQQTAPLGRAVMGSLIAATVATMFLLPAFYALLQGNRRRSASIHPMDDPALQSTPPLDLQKAGMT